MTSASGSFRTDDDCRIAWRTDGDASSPPLLVANSLGTNLGMWDQQVPVWAEERYVIRFDMRGHGGSEVASEGFGIDRLGRDALELLDHLKIARCDFVGLSLGGMIGQWLGVNAPERLGRLVLTNTSAYMGPPESWDARIAAVRSGGMAGIADAVVERWFTPRVSSILCRAGCYPADVARYRSRGLLRGLCCDPRYGSEDQRWRHITSDLGDWWNARPCDAP